ncbi:MAG: DUF4230 domain-containing protein [Terrimicrobiaceae bacterium]
MPDNDPLTRPRQKSGCLTVFAWVALAGAVSILLTVLVIWRTGSIVTEEARQMAASVAADFQRTLNFTPEVRVDSVVIVAGTTPALELATATKQALVRHRWTHTWLQSTKNLEIEATFTAKAGFDLSQPFRIQINPETKWISAELPQPKILSIGMSDVRIIRDEDGLWNKLTAQDREEAFRALEKEADKKFAASNLVSEALFEGEKRFQEVLKDSGARLKIEAAGPPQ